MDATATATATEEPPLPLTPGLAGTEKANFRHLVADIAWFGLGFPVLASFFAVYAIHLGATPLEMGLLSSLPAIFMLLSSTLSDWWRRRFDDSVRAVALPTLAMRVRLLLFAAVPLLPEAWRVPALITIASLVALPMGVSSIIFLVMMREAVSDSQITALVSRRLMVFNLAIAASTLLIGLWLENTPFPANYQAVFVVSFLFMLVSFWHVTQVRVIYPTPVPNQAIPPSAARSWRAPDFRGVALLIGALFVAFFSIVPVVPLQLVHGLGASEGFVAAYSLLELLGGATVSAFANRLIRRHGHHAVITLGMVGTGLAAVILAAAPALVFTLPAALLSGAAWTLTDICQFSFFSRNTTPENRQSRTRAYYQVLAIGTFIGPLVGSTLANLGLSLATVLLVGAGLRFLAGMMMQQHGLGRARGWASRVRPA